MRVSCRHYGSQVYPAIQLPLMPSAPALAASGPDPPAGGVTVRRAVEYPYLQKNTPGGVLMSPCRALTFTAVVVLGACASTTTFTSTWKAPDVQEVNPLGRTVAAVFFSRDESQRRAAEDDLAADLTARGARGVAAYTLLANEPSWNGDTALTKLKEAGVNGAVMMRVVGKDQTLTYTPGSTISTRYNRFGPYWGNGWSTVYDSGTVRTDTLVSVETLVYSLDRDKLLWAGTSRTTNPKNLTSLVKEAAAAAANEMVRQGVLTP